MKNYKAEVTLNEKDSLTDMLNTEKALVKFYATCITEGVSKGYRKAISKYLEETAYVQAQVFFMLTENDYARVEAAPEEERLALKEQFEEVKHQLS